MSRRIFDTRNVSITLALVAVIGCGTQRPRKVPAPRNKLPAPSAIDLRVAERFAAEHLDRIDEISCSMTPAAAGAEIPCTAFRIDGNAMQGIMLHCKTVEAPGTGPACRLGTPFQGPPRRPSMPGSTR
jgi:hypothetical protein